MNEVIAYISNPTCFNTKCSGGSGIIPRKQQQKANISHSNCVWKAELRVRYIPTDLKELYENERTTCHFYFDQVRNHNKRSENSV